MAADCPSGDASTSSGSVGTPTAVRVTGRVTITTRSPSGGGNQQAPVEPVALAAARRRARRRQVTEADDEGVWNIPPGEVVAVLDEQWDELVTYFRRRAGEDVAEDLAAETVAQAWAKRHNYQPEKGPLAAWMQGFATKVYHRWVRDRARQAQAMVRAQYRLGEPVVNDDIAEAVVARLPWESRVKPLGRALRRLTPMQRKILIMHLGYDIPCGVVAEILEMNPSTVRSHLRRGRTALRRELDCLDEFSELTG